MAIIFVGGAIESFSLCGALGIQLQVNIKDSNSAGDASITLFGCQSFFFSEISFCKFAAVDLKSGIKFLRL